MICPLYNRCRNACSACASINFPVRDTVERCFENSLTKAQVEFFQSFPKSILADCLSELYGFEEAFGDSTISETIGIFLDEIKRRK